MREIRFDTTIIFALLLSFGLFFCKTIPINAKEPAIVVSISGYNSLMETLHQVTENAGFPGAVRLWANNQIPLHGFDRNEPVGFALICDREPFYFFFQFNEKQGWVFHVPNGKEKLLPQNVGEFLPKMTSDKLFHATIYPSRLPMEMIEIVAAIARSQLAQVDSDIALMIQNWQGTIVEMLRSAQLIEFSCGVDQQGGLLFEQNTIIKKGEDEEFNSVGYYINVEVFENLGTLIRDQLWLPIGYSLGELKDDDRLDSNFFSESVQRSPSTTEPISQGSTTDTSTLFLTPGKEAGEQRTLNVNGVSLSFCWIPSGTFLMGSPKEESHRDSSEIQHEVTITNGFWMLQTEVTQAIYQAICANNPSNFIGDLLPVDTVTWHDCIEFCEKLTALSPPSSGTFSLPTEQQWEYAARAGTTGETTAPLEEIAWFGEPTATGSTHPVATKKPNSWNLFDMTGNLWEWCLTPYYDYPDPENAEEIMPTDITSTTPTFDPPTRIDRGGCWDSPAHQCRNAARGTYERDRKSRFVGFRIVLIPVEFEP